MELFQKAVLKSYLKQQDNDAVEKAYRRFTKYFHKKETQDNIRKIKEKGFNRNS